MQGTISASLHAGICIVREAPSQMDLLVRAFPDSPRLLVARGALVAAPQALLLWRGHRESPTSAAATRCHGSTLPPTTALPLGASHAPGWGWILMAAAAVLGCPWPSRHKGMFSSIIPHPCMLNTCTQNPAVLILPERDSGTRAVTA